MVVGDFSKERFGRPSLGQNFRHTTGLYEEGESRVNKTGKEGNNLRKGKKQRRDNNVTAGTG